MMLQSRKKASGDGREGLSADGNVRFKIFARARDVWFVNRKWVRDDGGHGHILYAVG